MSINLPGTSHHQALLARIIDHYQADSRVLAVCLFGSLVRGNWDAYSDLDLDAVIADDVQIDVLAEMQALCTAFQPLGERPLILVPDGADAGNIVLASQMELSIRYHVLAATSPNIVDHLRLLTSKLALETLQAAGRANRQPERVVSSYDVDRFLRWALEVKLQLRRQHFWQAERLLQYMRETLIEIFGVSRGAARAYHAFDDSADNTLQAALGATFPAYSLESIQVALFQMLNVLENQLTTLSNGQLQLTDAQREILAQVRA